MTLAILSDPDFAIVATGALVGIAAALVGPFLILRGQSLLTDAISHAILLGIVVVWMLTGAVAGPVQIAGAALTGLLTVWLAEVLARTGRVKDDAAVGLVFPALFALGVLMLNVYAREVHIDAHTVLLGEIGFVWLDLVTVAGVEVPRLVAQLATAGTEVTGTPLQFGDVYIVAGRNGQPRHCALHLGPNAILHSRMVTCGAVREPLEEIGGQILCVRRFGEEGIA